MSHHVIHFDNEGTSSTKSKGLFSLQRSWRRLPRLQRTIIILIICIFSTIILRYSLFKQSMPLSVRNRIKDNENLDLIPVHERQLIHENQKFQLVPKEPVKPVEALRVPHLTEKSTNMSKEQLAVIEVFKHSWKAYKLYAWGKDEVHPLTRSYSTWMGAALTMVDALDTMYIMGLSKEYKEARNWIAENLKFDLDKDHVNVFETTIRILGGLVSIFYLTGDRMYLKKAIDLGDRLLPAFDTASGVPLSDINLARKTAQTAMWTRDSTTAEVATLSLEFLALARASGEERFRKVITRLTRRLHLASKPDGLVSIYISPDTGQLRTSSLITLGARGDTYYEYILKQWIYNNKTDDYLQTDYLASVQGMKKRLLRRSKPNNLLFAGELTGGHSFYNKMDHLVCFLPGMLAYGVMHGMPLDHARIAKEVMKTCYQMYASMPTGLSPEIAHFNMDDGQEKKDIYVKPLDKHNLQRPETVESLMYMYRLTKDKKYREWGWNILQSFIKYTKEEPAGYVSIGDVMDTMDVRKRTKCESFWFSETLKYFFLLFSPDSVIDLKKYVITTEAHPLPIR